MGLYRLTQLIFVTITVVTVLVWAMPSILRTGPRWCARWNLTTGICGDRVLESLRRFDRWADRTLRPYSRKIRLDRALEKSYASLRTVEGAARKGVGDETVDAAVRGVGIALAEVEKLIGEGKTREKLGDVPENAQKLLAEARHALEQLRSVLSRTERRTEDVTVAVDNTRKALDALSDVLPKE